MDPAAGREKMTDKVLGGELSLGALRPFHWLVLAIVALIGVLMFFDDGQPVRVQVVGLAVKEVRQDPLVDDLPSCEFRLDVTCRHDRNVTLLLVSASDEGPAIHQLSPPLLVPGSSKRLPTNPRQAGVLYNLPEDTSVPFSYPWVAGMGVVVVSSDPAQMFSPAVIQGLVETAKIVLSRGSLNPSTYRRLVKALRESAQHDLIEAHVQWIDLSMLPR